MTDRVGDRDRVGSENLPPCAKGRLGVYAIHGGAKDPVLQRSQVADRTYRFRPRSKFEESHMEIFARYLKNVYNCNLCGFTYLRPEVLLDHYNMMHSTEYHTIAKSAVTVKS